MDQQRYSIEGMAYEVVGSTVGFDVVFIHGWGCDRKSLQEQASFFSQRSRVISADLPGFGNSPPIANPTVQNLAQSVLSLLSHLGVVGAFVVGHSMGGLVGLEMSRQAPDVVGRLAMIDTVLWPGQELRGAIVGLNDKLKANRLDDALIAAKGALFMPYDLEDIVERFAQSFKSADRNTIVASFAAHLIDYDPEHAIAALRCPICYIATDSALTSLDVLTNKISRVRIGKVIGSGHFAPRLVPEQVNFMLEAFASLKL